MRRFASLFAAAVGAAGLMLAVCCSSAEAQVHISKGTSIGAPTTGGGAGGGGGGAGGGTGGGGSGSGGGNASGGSSGTTPQVPSLTANINSGCQTGGGLSGGTGGLANGGNGVGNTKSSISGNGNCNTNLQLTLQEIIKSIGNIDIANNHGPVIVDITQ